MTLVEMMIGLGVGALVLAGVMGTSVFTSRSFVAMGNYCDLSDAGRDSVDYISEDIRQADFLISYTNTTTTNALVFQTTDPNSGARANLIYTYNTAAQTLTRSLGLQGGTLVTNTVLLTNCTYFHFDLYKRNPVATNGGSLVALASTNQPNIVKALDLTWTCSRNVLGISLNSEAMQSAQVVIRKE